VRLGRRLGVDVGSVRIGVAVSDAQGLMAVPVQTVARGRGDLAQLVALAAEHAAVEVVVGLPVTMGGAHGPAADAVADFAAALGGALAASQRTGPVPVRLVDERLTTASAHRALAGAGMGGRRRRSVVDQSAAVMILQTALDAERSTGRPAGVAAQDRRPSRPSQGGA
jgi:putative holliday junction resolvase